jgi:hypothetical protein
MDGVGLFSSFFFHLAISGRSGFREYETSIARAHFHTPTLVIFIDRGEISPLNGGGFREPETQKALALVNFFPFFVYTYVTIRR